MAPNSVRSVDVAQGTTFSEATRNASSLAELISTIPQTWRPACGAALTECYRIATKMCTVQGTISQYERHIAEGSFPPSIRNSLKDPKVQFSKEFLGSSVGARAPEALTSQVGKARKDLLNCALSRKKEELAELQSRCAFNIAGWRSVIAEVAGRTAKAFGIEANGEINSDKPPVWTKGTPKELQSDCADLWTHGSTLHFRTIAIARSIADRTTLDRMRTLKIKESTDHQMKDADLELSTRDVVRDEMKAQLAALKSDLVKSMSSTSTGKRHDAPLTLNRQSKKSRTSKEGRVEPLSWHQERESQKLEKEGTEQETRVISTQSFLAECSKDFRPWLAGTYPIVYNGLTEKTRMRIGFALMRTWEVDTLRAARPGVFKHPNVVIPEDVEYMLAVNHKFILPQDPKPHDVRSAQQALARTVRIRWCFRDQSNENYIPKFHVANPFWKPPKASPLIEQGLQEAMSVLDSQVSQALSSIATRPSSHRLQWGKVRDFLEDNDLLVKLTDKNLGLAVLPIQWYDAMILQMLADTSVYRHVPSIPVAALRDELYGQVHSWDLPPAMEKYILNKTKDIVPEFHAIPKVHKVPWKLRPIVPSHSWITTTTSEVLDHLCQPLLKLYPWVVSSSKEVIKQIETVTVPKIAPVWIVTGDVVAFYSNIPIKPCCKIVAGLWKTECKDSAIRPSTIRKMVDFVMKNNYLSYQGQNFHQINGLAMGTAAAPVLANLYAAYYERKARVVHQEGVLLYVRYIDDIFALFQGTKEEVKEWAESISIGPLSITWQFSLVRNEFLDIELIGNPGNCQVPVDTRLFRKRMNRHLYIPWSSAHPIHVKKGFVTAELTRYVLLSSKYEYFADSRKELYGNLRRRGYPAKTLNEWFTTVQYSNRPVTLLDKPKNDRVPLMLPGHYNPVWEFIDVKKVISAARKFWVQEELPESLEEPLIRSLGKTTSLFDLLSAWNKTNLLQSSDD